MSKSDENDLFEGFVGRKAPRAERSRSTFPLASICGSGKRARTAWFNRKTGAGAVKLKAERPAGSQRVIVKAKVVVHAKAGGGGAGGLMRHALYVERDGAGRDGEGVTVFDAEIDRANGATFVARCENDRHHFRIILSPENGGEFKNLKDYTRDLMQTVEADLGTRIDWIAAEHHDTGRPHVHLLMRGVRDNRRDLVIPRAYISHSFRERAEEIATRELGHRVEHELSQQMDRHGERTARRERFTYLDEALLDRARGREISIADLPGAARERGPLVQRLNRLEELGLAERAAPNTWRLDPQLEVRLLRLGEGRDRARVTARLLAREDRAAEAARIRELEDAHSSTRVTGRLVGFEQLGDNASGPYLIGVEGTDRKFWTARIARVEELRVVYQVERGAIIRLERAMPDLKPSDRTILEIAGEDGVYSAARHKETIPSDRDTYIDAHVRRLEALRREGVVERTQAAEFFLPPDYADRVRQFEGRRFQLSAKVELLDPHGVEHQARYHGPAWLDRLDEREISMDGFGAETRIAWQTRAKTLKALGLAEDHPKGLAMVDDWKEQLQQIERRDILQKIERDTGHVPHFAREGDRVEGLFVSRIHAAEKSHALILQDRTATLVPWRPDMDRAMNQYVAGQVRGLDFDFTFGKGVEKARDLSRSKGLDLGL